MSDLFKDFAVPAGLEGKEQGVDRVTAVRTWEGGARDKEGKTDAL